MPSISLKPIFCDVLIECLSCGWDQGTGAVCVSVEVIVTVGSLVRRNDVKHPLRCLQQFCTAVQLLFGAGTHCPLCVLLCVYMYQCSDFTPLRHCLVITYIDCLPTSHTILHPPEHLLIWLQMYIHICTYVPQSSTLSILCIRTYPPLTTLCTSVETVCYVINFVCLNDIVSPLVLLIILSFKILNVQYCDPYSVDKCKLLLHMTGGIGCASQLASVSSSSGHAPSKGVSQPLLCLNVERDGL